MKIALISPYHGGSHQAWAAGYIRQSRHEVELFSLPARFWKWRMHGGAVTLARRFLASGYQPDLILATDMLDVTTFLALTRRATAGVPVALYMHENQLTYPLPEDGSTGPMRRQLGERDQHYAFVNFASMLAADHVFFNSSYHRAAFFEALPRFLKHFPENNELNSIARLQAKSSVMPVGIDLRRLDRHRPSAAVVRRNHAPLIIWNQRWEYDKNPEAFFAALFALKEEGLAFRLALCGQQFGRAPAVFDEAADRLRDNIIHMGHADSRQYGRLLWSADITVSTAIHEFFGISVAEAIYCRTFPILPRRLSYPELVPAEYHAQCLFDGREGLLDRLRWAVCNGKAAGKLADSLAGVFGRFDWRQTAPVFDRSLDELR